ncbi:MAG: hypothetical protein OQJ84_08575, partial [Xanthomonadales bacterium]|nr:hypothetical protein [Xanthomonadales bacterium]
SNALDINTTLLGLAGVEPPEYFHGLDLMPLVLKDPGAKKFTPRDFVVTEMLQVDLNGRMVAGDDYKYILFDGGKNPEVLFDLANDPGELVNVANDPRYREKLTAARQTLRNWVKETGDPFNIDSMPGSLPAVAETDATAVPDAAAERTWGDRAVIPSQTMTCGSNTKGLVKLEISGKPGDSFRVYLRCGDDNVSKCTARVNSGSTTASCEDGPRTFTPGEYRCSTKPLIGNSPEAKVTSAVCE